MMVRSNGREGGLSRSLDGLNQPLDEGDSKGVIVKTVGMSILVFLIVPILMGCIPAESKGFSIYLLADEVPATELSIADLNALSFRNNLFYPVMTSWCTRGRDTKLS